MIRCYTLAFAAILTAGAASAEPVQYHLYATWADLPAADVYLTLNDPDVSYRAEIDIRSLGIVKVFSKFGAHGVAVGTLTAPHDTASPMAYETDYKLRKKRNHISLHDVLAADGVVAERTPADTSNKPQLDVKFRRKTLDPLAALAAARATLRARRPPWETNLRLAIYDGKRRFDAEVSFVGSELLTLAEGPVKALHLHLLLTPIAGFRTAAEEGEDIEGKPREADIYFSDDDRLIPLQMTLSVFYLPAVARLVGTCNDASPCKIPPF